MEKLRSHIEKSLGIKAEVKNVLKSEEMKSHRKVLALFLTFGPMCLPIITIGDEVVSMGNPTPGEAVEAIREKIGQQKATNSGGV